MVIDNMPRKRPTSKHHYDWTYRENFYFLLGFEPAEVIAWLKKNRDTIPSHDLNHYDGCMLTVDDGFAVWVRGRKKDASWYSRLAHECVHAGTAALNRRHIEISYSNDETLCYLVQSLVRASLEQK